MPAFQLHKDWVLPTIDYGHNGCSHLLIKYQMGAVTYWSMHVYSAVPFIG